MICLEYESLSRNSFATKQDFDYLLAQELPCFDIIIKAGEPQLLVKHYLAKIMLPSGMTLEILPKVSNIHTTSNTTFTGAKYALSTDLRQQQIYHVRQWVKQMLSDIALQMLPKSINALEDSLGELNPNYHAQTPWYEWLLTLAMEKLEGAWGLLPNRYQMQAHNSPQAKGKLNLKAQFKSNWHRPHYLHTEQTIWSADDLLTQYLATAWHRAIQLSGSQGGHFGQYEVRGNTRINWQGVPILAAQEWQAVYDHIWRTKVRWHTQLSPQQKDTLEQAVAWAWWVLQDFAPLSQPSPANAHTPPTSNHRRLPATALMINMNHAFERWVLARLGSWTVQHCPDSRLVIQPSLDWLSVVKVVKQEIPRQDTDSRYDKMEHNGGQIIQKLIPDAYIETADGVISHVIDIKYKPIYRVQDISGRDWQQLYMYQQYLQAPNAWLIYPITASFTAPVTVGQASCQYQTSSQTSQIASTGVAVNMTALPFDMISRQIIMPESSSLK